MPEIYVPEMAGRKEAIAILAQQVLISMVQGRAGDAGPSDSLAYDAFRIAKAYYDRRDKEQTP